LITSYFFLAGMIIQTIPEGGGYSKNDYYKAWFGAQFFGMLVWGVTMGVSGRRDR
jgi:hypothetical protein